MGEQMTSRGAGLRSLRSCGRVLRVFLLIMISLSHDTLLIANFSGFCLNPIIIVVFSSYYMSPKAVLYHQVLDVYIVQALWYEILALFLVLTVLLLSRPRGFQLSIPFLAMAFFGLAETVLYGSEILRSLLVQKVGRLQPAFHSLDTSLDRSMRSSLPNTPDL